MTRIYLPSKQVIDINSMTDQNICNNHQSDMIYVNKLKILIEHWCINFSLRKQL